MNTPHIKEAARDIPVLMQADVVVVGGGTTGPIAAIAAARRGCKVVLIERFGSLGGVLTLGLNTKPSGSLLGGIPLEIWNLARSAGGAGAESAAAAYMVFTLADDVAVDTDDSDPTLDISSAWRALLGHCCSTCWVMRAAAAFFAATRRAASAY